MHTQTSQNIGSREACQILFIDKSTLSRWVLMGRITPIHQNPGKNGAMIFARNDVEALKPAA